MLTVAVYDTKPYDREFLQKATGATGSDGASSISG